MAFNAYNKVDVLRDSHGINAVNNFANSAFKIAGTAVDLQLINSSDSS